MFGLAGAHRTGKSTMAKAVAEATKIAYLNLSMTPVYQRLGMSPNQLMDAEIRLAVQEACLEHMAQLLNEAPSEFVSDRTPIDLMAYTLLNLPVDLTKEQTARTFAYVSRCYDLCNQHFEAIMRVQPGIPLVEEEGKALAQPVYIESLNAFMYSLLFSTRVTAQSLSLDRNITELARRVEIGVDIVRQIRQIRTARRSMSVYH